MTQSTQSTVKPLERLHEYCTMLEASIALVLSKPGKRPVHQLRTSTRRVEAQLTLLATMSQRRSPVNSIKKISRRIRKLLKEVRRAAGTVRDLDVQLRLLKDESKGTEGRKVRSERVALRRHLKERRSYEAEALVTLLSGHAVQLPARLEKMLTKLGTLPEIAVSPAELIEVTQRWFREEEGAPTSQDRYEDALHDIRKRAKLARYVLESGGSGAPAREAKAFEALQQSGGNWHDQLTLKEVAKQTLGRRAELVARFHQGERRALAEFRGMLIRRGVRQQV